MNVLIIGQDNLFAGIPGVAVDHVSTRLSYTPNSASDPSSRRNPLTCLFRFLLGRYHLAVLPAVDLDWPHNLSAKQKYTRLLLRTLVRARIAQFLSKLLKPRRTHIAILDRYDYTTIYRDAALFFNADSYWKTNFGLPHHPDLPFPVMPIGLWTYQPELISPPVPWQQKDIDIFAAFSVNAPQRERVLQWVRQFAADYPQFNVIVPAEPLTRQDFQDHLARTRICLSPEGMGFQCFRHYESMHHGAVPLITRNPNVLTDLNHNENCLFYDDHEDGFVSAALNALQDVDHLEKISSHIRGWVKLHHTPQAIGNKILKYAVPSPS